MSPILNILLYIKLLTMVLTWLTTHYTINIVYILGIWIIKCLILPTDAEEMGRHRLMREGDDSLCLISFHKKSLLNTYHMLVALWLHLLDGLGHYVSHPEAIEEVLMITSNKIMSLGYTYDKRRLKKPPDIV